MYPCMASCKEDAAALPDHCHTSAVGDAAAHAKRDNACGGAASDSSPILG